MPGQTTPRSRRKTRPRGEGIAKLSERRVHGRIRADPPLRRADDDLLCVCSSPCRALSSRGTCTMCSSTGFEGCALSDCSCDVDTAIPAIHQENGEGGSPSWTPDLRHPVRARQSPSETHAWHSGAVLPQQEIYFPLSTDNAPQGESCPFTKSAKVRFCGQRQTRAQRALQTSAKLEATVSFWTCGYRSLFLLGTQVKRSNDLDA